uniref:Uncharacterized protein n=1 Tax=Oryza sativa subsp. japonica TaxID=39947 RepID=Q75I29_ORYSJ|nr:hypothetical protein [Oryza sativa Japonica Group]
MRIWRSGTGGDRRGEWARGRAATDGREGAPRQVAANGEDDRRAAAGGEKGGAPHHRGPRPRFHRLHGHAPRRVRAPPATATHQQLQRCLLLYYRRRMFPLGEGGPHGWRSMATATATGPLPPRHSGHRLAGGGACPVPSPRGPQPRGASSLPPPTPMDAAAAAAPRGVTEWRPSSSSASGGPLGDGAPWSGGEKGGAPLHSHRHAESAGAQSSTAAPASPAAASPRVALPHHAGPSSRSPPSPAILSIPTAAGLLFSTPPRRPSQSTAAP